MSNVNLTFDDQAAKALPNEDPAASGSYKPTNYGPSTPDACPNEGGDAWPGAPPGPYGSALSVFDGTDPNGTWSLYVVDDCGGDAGKINGGWSLTFSGPTVATLASFSAREQGKKAVVVRWRSVSENGLLGFNLYRARGESGSFTKLNRSLIKAHGGVAGHAYRFQIGRAHV